MSLSPRSRLSRVTAADLAGEVDAVFKSHEKFQKRSSSFASTASRFKEKLSQGPGPTTYTTTSGGGRAAFLDSKASRDSTRKPTTDCMYNVDPGWKGGKSISAYGSAGFVSKTPRGNMRHSDAPDPTRYQPDQTQTTLTEAGQEATASFRSRSPRMKYQASYTPSPQAYSVSRLSDTRSNTAAFVSTTPRMRDATSSGPSPGSHEVASSFAKAATGGNGTNSFRSTNPRMQIKGNDVPAPGAYDLPNSLSTKGGLVSRTPRTKVSLTHSPGPTAYSVSPSTATATTPASAAFRSSSARFRDEKPTSGTTYNAGGTSWGQTKGGAFTSTAPKLVSRYNDNPGPGTYTAQGAKSTKGGIWGRSKRPTQRSYTPGPGTYAAGGIGDSSGRAATASFRSTSARGHTDYKSGPTHHYVGSGLSSRGGKMTSKAERFKMNPNDTPAPGHSIQFYSSFLD